LEVEVFNTKDQFLKSLIKTIYKIDPTFPYHTLFYKIAINHAPAFSITLRDKKTGKEKVFIYLRPGKYYLSRFIHELLHALIFKLSLPGKLRDLCNIFLDLLSWTYKII